MDYRRHIGITIPFMHARMQDKHKDTHKHTQTHACTNADIRSLFCPRKRSEMKWWFKFKACVHWQYGVCLIWLPLLNRALCASPSYDSGSVSIVWTALQCSNGVKSAQNGKYELLLTPTVYYGVWWVIYSTLESTQTCWIEDCWMLCLHTSYTGTRGNHTRAYVTSVPVCMWPALSPYLRSRPKLVLELGTIWNSSISGTC